MMRDLVQDHQLTQRPAPARLGGRYGAHTRIPFVVRPGRAASLPDDQPVVRPLPADVHPVQVEHRVGVALHRCDIPETSLDTAG